MNTDCSRLTREAFYGSNYGEFLQERFPLNEVNRQRTFAQWLYVLNPEMEGREDLSIYVCWHDGKPVGQLGILPFKGFMRGEPINGGWCVDFYVSPKAQRGGVGRKLLQAAHSDFPILSTLGQTDLAYNFFLKNNWRLNGALTCCKQLLNLRTSIPKMVLRKAKLFPHSGGSGVSIPCRFSPAVGTMSVTELTDFSEQGPLFEARNSGKRSFVVRSIDFMKWRYLDCPHGKYSILRLDHEGESAIAVMRLYRYARWKRGQLVDLIYRGGLEAEHVATFVSTVSAIALASGVEVFEIETSDTKVLQACPDHAFSSRVESMRLLCGCADGSQPKEIPIHDWRLYTGDCDVDIVTGVCLEGQ